MKEINSDPSRLSSTCGTTNAKELFEDHSAKTSMDSALSFSSNSSFSSPFSSSNEIRDPINPILKEDETQAKSNDIHNFQEENVKNCSEVNTSSFESQSSNSPNQKQLDESKGEISNFFRTDIYISAIIHCCLTL